MWINLNESDLNEYLPAAQLKALQTKSLGVGQADVLPSLIGEIVALVRNTIASAGLPVESAAGTFPEVLKPYVAALVIELAQTRLPGLSLTTEQRAQVTAARNALAQILAHKMAIEAPAAPDYTLSSSGTTSAMRVITSRENQLTADQLRRLS